MRSKILMLVLVTLLAVFGTASGLLWRSLQAEKLLNAGPRARSADSGVSAEAQSSMVAGPAKATDQVTPYCNAEVWLPSEEFLAVAEAIIARIPRPISGVPTELELLRDPEYRKASLERIRLTEAYINPGLAETVGLTEEEAKQLFQIRAEAQMDLMMAAANATDRSPARALTEAVMRKSKAPEDATRALLGEARYAQLGTYSREIQPVLEELSSMTYVLASAGKPLSESQAQALKTVLSADRKNPQRELPQPASRRENQPNAGQMLSQYQDRQKEKRARTLAVVAPYLNPEQLAVLQRQIEVTAPRCANMEAAIAR